MIYDDVHQLGQRAVDMIFMVSSPSSSSHRLIDRQFHVPFEVWREEPPPHASHAFSNSNSNLKLKLNEPI